jgi:hypothetical protein
MGEPDPTIQKATIEGGGLPLGLSHLQERPRPLPGRREASALQSMVLWGRETGALSACIAFWINTIKGFVLQAVLRAFAILQKRPAA